jgi:hypothetical protein
VLVYFRVCYSGKLVNAETGACICIRVSKTGVDNKNNSVFFGGCTHFAAVL